jgi:hypothetical protein
MMDTIFLNFGVRPSQFHQALIHFNAFQDDEEVRQYQQEKQQQAQEYHQMRQQAIELSAEAKAYVKGLMDEMEVKPDTRGILNIQGFN